MQSLMKRIGVSVAVAAAMVLGNVPTALAAPEIAVVDTVKLATNSKPGRAAADYLTKVQTSLQKSMDEVQSLYKGKENTEEGRNAILQGKSALDQQLMLYRQAVAAELDKAIAESITDWRKKNKKTQIILPGAAVMDFDNDAEITSEIMPLLDKKTIKFPEMPKVTVNKPEKK